MRERSISPALSTATTLPDFSSFKLKYYDGLFTFDFKR
jgi:hypothetical protein